MRLFENRKPRKFHHEYIYVDERREHLDNMEKRIKREIGIIPPEEFKPEDLRGAFVYATKHLRRRKEREAAGHRNISVGVIILLLILLSILLFYLNY